MRSLRTTSPRERRVWSLILGLAPLAFLVVPLTVDDGAYAPRWVAVALVLAVPLLWWTIGRLCWTRPWAGIAYLAGFAAVVLAAMVACPPLAFLQALLFPAIWLIMADTRRSVLASIVFGALLVAVHSIGATLEGVLAVIAMAAISVGMSIGIGLSISMAWRYADQRQTLLDELRATQEQLVDASRLAGVSSERERMSRELHDTLAQSLVGAGLLVERAQRTSGRIRAAALDGSPSEALRADLAKQSEQLDAIADVVREALGETRAVIAESAPVHDGDAPSFLGALERLAERIRRETGIDVTLDAELDAARLDRATQVVLLRCAQEGLANVRRHAQASAVTVRVRAEAGVARLELADDGVGFAPERGGAGFGLPGLRERARGLGGTLAVESEPGRGTRIVVEVPACGSDDARGDGAHGAGPIGDDGAGAASAAEPGAPKGAA